MNPTAARHKMPGYYPTHDSADEGVLNIQFHRPARAFNIPATDIVDHRPGIRCRIVIEGLVEYVARLHDAMAAELTAIKRELEP